MPLQNSIGLLVNDHDGIIAASSMHCNYNPTVWKPPNLTKIHENDPALMSYITVIFTLRINSVRPNFDGLAYLLSGLILSLWVIIDEWQKLHQVQRTMVVTNPNQIRKTLAFTLTLQPPVPHIFRFSFFLAH